MRLFPRPIGERAEIAIGKLPVQGLLKLPAHSDDEQRLLQRSGVGASRLI